MTPKQLEALLNEHIRAQLLVQGQDVVIAQLSEKSLTLMLKGSCCQCPSAICSVREMMEQFCLAYAPKISQVSIVAAVDEQLINLAKRVLSGKEALYDMEGTL